MNALRRGSGLFFLSLCFLFSPINPAAAEDRPWGFWAKTEEKDTPDSEYAGKPRIEPTDAVKKKRETQEDLRGHVQKELAKADLTTEKGRRDWEEKDKAVRKARMEELKQQKREKVEEVKKLRGKAHEEKKDREKKKETAPAKESTVDDGKAETESVKILVPGEKSEVTTTL